MKNWLWVIAALSLCSCRDSYPSRWDDPNYPNRFYIKMPEFMAPWPETDDVAEFRWGWGSIDETIEVVCSGGVIPRKTLKPSVALNKEVKRKWSWLLSMEASFKKTGKNRYQSIAKGTNQWEIIIAEETDENWFWIKVFVISSRAESSSNSAPPLQLQKAEKILESLESGRFVNNETYLKLMGEGALEKEWVVVDFLRGGAIIYNNKKISLSEFTDISRDAVDENPKTRLHIRTYKKSSNEEIKAVVRAAAKGGLEDVIVGPVKD